MTDYEKILMKAQEDPEIEDYEVWDTADGEKAITLHYNLYYHEEYTFDPQTEKCTGYEELKAN